MRYFTSDLHFFHKLMLWKYRSRCKTLDEMNEEIVIAWNKTVKKSDLVYVLGDVSFGKYDETKALVQRLNGRKFLIRGNHCERFSSKKFIEMGFEDVRDTYTFTKNGEKWLLSHYPYSSAFKFYYYKIKNKLIFKKNESAYYKLYLPYKGYKLIHGHVHSGPLYKFDQVNVAWDHNRKLLSENDIEAIFKINQIPKIKRFLETLKLIFF